MTEQTRSGSALKIGVIILGAAVLGFAGGWAWQMTGAGRGATEQVVRDYILEHPEILPEAMQRLQERELASRLAPLRSTLEQPYPGAVLGNPNGSVTLVEFADYACPYCRVSVAEVEALIAADKDLRVVMREDAVLGPDSVEAARMALAAADQGHYAAFHKAMFAKERPTPEAIAAAATEAGLDLAKARADIATGKYDFELENNRRLAAEIGFSGTPSWVIGDRAYSGAQGRETLAEAVAQARKAKAAKTS